MRKCPYLKCIQSKYAQIIRIWTARYTTRQKLTQQRSFIHIWWHYNSTHYKTIWIKFSYCDWWQLYRLVEESLVDSTLPSRLPNRFCFLSKDLPPQHLHFIDSYPHHGNGICHLQHISHTNVIHYLLKTKYRENVFLRTTRTVYTSPGQSNANSMFWCWVTFPLCRSNGKMRAFKSHIRARLRHRGPNGGISSGIHHTVLLPIGFVTKETKCNSAGRISI